MNIILFLALFLFNVQPIQASFRQQAQRDRTGRERISAEGSRGCNFAQGELSLESEDKDKLVVNQNATIILFVTPSPDPDFPQQTVRISLVDLETKETTFFQEYLVKGESTLTISPDFPLIRPQILSAGLVCNPNRPSTNKSLRILLIPDDK
ncbi:MAG: hypothetical protein ACRDEA_23090 [Microcystaceae cyanobacterium]